MSQNRREVMKSRRPEYDTLEVVEWTIDESYCGGCYDDAARGDKTHQRSASRTRPKAARAARRSSRNAGTYLRPIFQRDYARGAIVLFYKACRSLGKLAHSHLVPIQQLQKLSKSSLYRDTAKAVTEAI